MADLVVLDRAQRQIAAGAILQQRRRLKLSRAAVAARAGVSEATIRNMERGRTPSANSLARVLGALDLPLESLVPSPVAAELTHLKQELGEVLAELRQLRQLRAKIAELLGVAPEGIPQMVQHLAELRTELIQLLEAGPDDDLIAKARARLRLVTHWRLTRT